MIDKVRARAYASPGCVLLAFDWGPASTRSDILGFAIRRTPGFRGGAPSWLPNRVGFRGPSRKGEDLPSNSSPIQKFLWWDSRINQEDGGRSFRYEISPVVGVPETLELLTASSCSLDVPIPRPYYDGIATHFNRAVSSSQAFSRKFGGSGALSGDKLARALAWLANGVQDVIPRFLGAPRSVEGAIYHLTDDHWIIPSMLGRDGDLSLVCHKDLPECVDPATLAKLQSKARISIRTRTSIMHNKFLVDLEDGEPKRVLTGSANFTTAGLCTQANVIHVIDSPPLARLYLERKRFLGTDPTRKETSQSASWSGEIPLGRSSKIRVFFAPERRPGRQMLDEVVQAVKTAERSILFCVFAPTDKPLLDAVFEGSGRGLVMYGLVNTIPGTRKPDGTQTKVSEAGIALYERSDKKEDFFPFARYDESDCPEGFWFERFRIPQVDPEKPPVPVRIHHKFVVIDADSDQPTVFTGSANMSANAQYNNDENLLEIRGNRRVAETYLVEFLRLYEHYRARAARARFDKGMRTPYRLRPDPSWKVRFFDPTTPEFRSRSILVKPPKWRPQSQTARTLGKTRAGGASR